jgi:hypothetical protein
MGMLHGFLLFPVSCYLFLSAHAHGPGKRNAASEICARLLIGDSFAKPNCPLVCCPSVFCLKINVLACASESGRLHEDPKKRLAGMKMLHELNFPAFFVEIGEDCVRNIPFPPTG